MMGAPMEGKRRPVSAVVIAKNEERRIAECLESLSWADEIVVVDSGSTDGTVETALRFTEKVFPVPWKGFGPQKQAAVTETAAAWLSDCRQNPPKSSRIRPVLY